VSDERIIQYLQQRGRVTPPHDLVANVMAAVDASPPQPSRFSPYLPAFVAVGAAAVIAVLALVLGPGRDIGPAPTPSTAADAARPASVDELREAVMAGLEVLKAKPGVEGVGTSHVLDEVGSVSWFSWRPNGDQVVVTRSDVDVTESGWWRDPTGEPPSRGTNILTTMQVLLGDDYYLAQGDIDDGEHWGWARGSRSDSPDILAVPFPAALDGRLNPWTFAPTAEGDVTLESLADGGQVWTATSSLREGLVVQEFGIGPDGALRSVSHELVGVSPALEDPPFTSAFVELTALEDPDPIPEPDTESPPDPAAFGMPDLSLAPGPQDADIDYRVYVEDVLEALEALHWNSAEVDWQAARSAALDGLPDDPPAAQAHARIRRAIETFDFFSTVFVRPQDVTPGDRAGDGEPLAVPVADRLGDVGHLSLPSPGDSVSAEAVRAYVRAGRVSMAAVEEVEPACGWVVDLRDYAGGAWGPPILVLGGLIGEGRAVNFASLDGEWGLGIDANGLVTVVAFDDSDMPVGSPYFVESESDDEFAQIVASEPPHVSATNGPPVAVLVGNGTARGGEQTLVAFLGRPSTRVFGGPTAGSPIVAPNLQLIDGAVLRVPTWVPVDRDGTRHETNILPDEVVGDTRAGGTDAVLDSALEWLAGEAECP